MTSGDGLVLSPLGGARHNRLKAETKNLYGTPSWLESGLALHRYAY